MAHPVNPSGGTVTLRPAPGGAGGDRVLTMKEMLELTHQPGMEWNGLAIAAIGMAESGGHTHARHTNSDGSIDRGWLQINTIHKDVPDSVADDPVKAVWAAYKLWKEAGGKKGNSKSGYTIWSTFGGQAWKDNVNTLLKSGLYKGGVPQLVQDNGQSPIGAAVNGAVDAATAIPDFLGKLGVIFDRTFWLRAGQVILGAVALIAGVLLIGKTYVK